MSHATFFDADCPTCGRPLRVRITLLGKRVKCSHCSAAFAASPSGDDSGVVVFLPITESCEIATTEVELDAFNTERPSRPKNPVLASEQVIEELSATREPATSERVTVPSMGDRGDRIGSPESKNLPDSESSPDSQTSSDSARGPSAAESPSLDRVEELLQLADQFLAAESN